MGKHYSLELKNQVMADYKSRKYGGRYNLAKHYGIKESAIKNWIKKEKIKKSN